MRTKRTQLDRAIDSLGRCVMSQYGTLWTQFHARWGANKEGVYDKQAWISLQEALCAVLQSLTRPE